MLIFKSRNVLKRTYEHLQFQKVFRLASARHILKDKGGEGRDGREGQGKGGKKQEKGEGKGRGQAS
jgi:hypothetical protein